MSLSSSFLMNSPVANVICKSIRALASTKKPGRSCCRKVRNNSSFNMRTGCVPSSARSRVEKKKKSPAKIAFGQTRNNLVAVPAELTRAVDNKGGGEF